MNERGTKEEIENEMGGQQGGGEAQRGGEMKGGKRERERGGREIQRMRGMERERESVRERDCSPLIVIGLIHVQPCRGGVTG